MNQTFFKELIHRREEPVARTTFTISAEVAEAAQWMVSEAGVSPRDLVDGLISQHSSGEEAGECLKEILDNLRATPVKRSDLRVRKTLSLSRSAVDVLSAAAREAKVSRDLLLNQILLQSRNCLERALEEECQAYRKAREEFLDWIEKGLEKRGEITEILRREGLDAASLVRILEGIQQQLKAGETAPAQAVARSRRFTKSKQSQHRSTI